MSETKPLFVDPKDIEEQRRRNWPDFHPEAYCHRCGGRNIWAWNVDSDRWNQALDPSEIACPQCFVEAWNEATGLRAVWTLVPSSIHWPKPDDGGEQS